MTFFHEDSSVTDSNVGRSSRVCDNDIKTFSHLISTQLHKFRSKKSGRVWCTCDWSEGFSVTGLFTCHPKVFLCGTKDFTRKEDHSPETQCSLKTWTKPASAYVAIKWVEQSSSSCQKSYHSGSLGSRPLMKPLYTRLETKPLILVLQTRSISTLSLFWVFPAFIWCGW